jgi:hypothetical protein
VYFAGVGANAFFGGISPTETNRGVASQFTFGIAYDTESGTLIAYKSEGTANQTTDVVSGIGAGVGGVIGTVGGKLEDFLGSSRERTNYLGPVSITTIETESGKRGFAWGGGMGLGLGYTSIQTYTSRLSLVSRCELGTTDIPIMPVIPAP